MVIKLLITPCDSKEHVTLITISSGVEWSGGVRFLCFVLVTVKMKTRDVICDPSIVCENGRRQLHKLSGHWDSLGLHP